MNLDQVTIEIRPRSAWEAVDLGILMARRWWWVMMKIWFIVSCPIFLLSLLIPQDKLVWAGLLIWWCKPIYERPLLYFLSRAVFNELPDIRSTLKQFPSLAAKQWFLSLTWRRFSFSRSMDLPVLQLEGLTGQRRQERLSVLHREDSNASGWLHVFGFFLEMFISLGVMGVIWALTPTEINIDWINLFWERESTLGDYIFHITGYLAMWLVAPFYVACGFSLYLNRRIKLEAWDLDIAFRRIVSKRQSSSVISILVLVICLFGINIQQDVYAQEETNYSSEVETTTNLNRDTAQTSIRELMQQDEFSHKETVERLRLKDQTEEDESAFIKWLIKWLDGSDNNLLSLGNLFELILWIVFLTLIGILIFRYRHWLAAQFVRVGSTEPLKEKPVTLFGMDVRRESLPADINAAAMALIDAGDKRAALALLYRASLAHLIFTGIEIEDGFTELECEQIMKKDLPRLIKTQNDSAYIESRIDYFSSLTRVWRRLAYGHLFPDEQTLLQLCTGWNQCWLKSAGNHA